MSHKFPRIVKLSLYGFISLSILLLLAVFILVKPMRVVFAHHIPSLQCTGFVCVDNPQKQPLAQTLYDQAVKQTQDKVGAFQQQPTMVFCSTAQCAHLFGMEKAAAKAVGDLGLLVAPRGWKSFYIRHELIHHRQAEEWGNIAMFTKPKWLVEGMAYRLSDDPRPTLSQPFQQWRAQFKLWHKQHPNADIWYTTQQVR